MRKLQSEKKSWCAVREFVVNPVNPENLAFKVESADMLGAMNCFDENPCSSFKSEGSLAFGVEKGTKSYTMLVNLPKAGGVVLKQYNKKGKLVASTPIEGNMAKVNVDANAVKCQLEGAVEVFEIVSNK